MASSKRLLVRGFIGTLMSKMTRLCEDFTEKLEGFNLLLLRYTDKHMNKKNIEDTLSYVWLELQDCLQ